MAETKDDRNSITQSEWEVMRIIWTLGEVRT
ncbi:CopY/TcrY family copper transport repressor, partial [Lactobacillus sp. UMNPBX5]